jgi:hypothetical protein
VERRQEAVRKRLLRPAAPVTFAGLSVLELASVMPSTAQDYAKRVAEFVRFCQAASAGWTNESELDILVTEFFDQKYWEGAPATDGSKFLAALAFAMPRLQKRLPTALPRACRCIKGWMKYAPPDQRLPLPLVMLCCIMAWFLQRRMAAHALCLYIQFLTYLRPGENVSMLRSQLIVPAPLAGQAYNSWAVNIAPVELGRPGKTGLHDESIMIRCEPWLSRWLMVLKTAGPEHEKLWPFTLPELARLFETAATACQCQCLRPTLYSIRHGGASEDLLHGCSINEVFRRGRWRSWSSLRRYGKEAKLQSELAKVPAPFILYGQRFGQRIGDMFNNPRSVPPLPTLPVA